MRLLITLIAVALLLVNPAILLAGDKVHHGHGMRSGWDSQTGSGFQGSEYIGEIPDFYRMYPPQHYRYGYPNGNRHYGYNRFNVTYSDGNWGASFNYINRSAPYCPYPNYYAPAQYYAAPYAYQQPVNFYSTPNYQRYPSPPIWSAAPNAGLGYYAQPASAYQQQQQPQVVNIYNYYSDEFNQQQPAAPAAPVRQQQAAPAIQDQQPAPRQSADLPVGTKFFSATQMSTPSGSMLFSLDNGTLYAGPLSGPPLAVATGVDAALGVLAAWQPGLGFSLVYRTGDSILASWNNGSDWLEEPLPEFIDFSKDVTVGMVGGSPWVVFNGFDGSRQIYTFAGGWNKLGSATQPEPEPKD